MAGGNPIIPRKVLGGQFPKNIGIHSREKVIPTNQGITLDARRVPNRTKGDRFP